MKNTRKLRVKICGITNHEDAEAAIEYGADALGFVFYSKSPRSVTQEIARSIITSLPPFVTTVGVFVDKDIKKCEEIAEFAGLDVIQLHGNEPPEQCISSKKVIKAIRVRDISDIDILSNFTSVSAFLLDTYSPVEPGGTGKSFNWDIAIEAKKYGNIILAGGLNPDNIEEAIRVVKPYAVDVSSGVEGNVKGKKDHEKLRLFIEKARKATIK